MSLTESTTNHNALFERAVKALSEMKDRPVILEMDMTHAVSMIGNLQLALRHPKNVGPSSRLMEAMVRDLIDRIDPGHGAVFHYLEAGFDPQFDE